ncbi:MAG: hypothetical protein WC556_02060 [Candidatus Methanoperedens sp.]
MATNLKIKMLNLFSKTKRHLFENLIQYKYCLSLILLNFLTHYYFILQYKFVADDWDILVYSKLDQNSIIELLLSSQRSILFIILKFVSDQFGGFALGYQILNIITSTIILLLIFSIAKHLSRKNNSNVNKESYAFITALIFVLLFNKDEMYAWSLHFSNNIAYILYLGSLYYFITSEKKTFKLIISVFLFSIAIFTYETGIFLPILYFIYDWINKQDLKKSLYFGLPLGLFGIARLTNWLGYGSWPNSNDMTSQNEFLTTYLRMILHSIGETINNVIFSSYGLSSLNPMILLGLVVMDILIIVFIFRYILIELKWDNFDGNYKNMMNLVLISIAGLILSYIPMAIRGYLATRHVLFIDIFISLLLAIFIGFIAKKRMFVFLMYIIIIFCVIVNQGLYINWITSGAIQESVNHSIFDNSNKLNQYNYIYINATDLSKTKPNSVIYALSNKDEMMRSQEKDRIYSPYIHSPGLEPGAVISMIEAANINLSKTTLIYGNYEGNNIFISSENTTLTYQNGSSGKYETINRSEYFEFNASNLLTYYKSYENTSFLFSANRNLMK